LINSGSYFAFVVIIIVKTGLLLLVRTWAKTYWRSDTIRKIGIKFYSKNLSFDFYYQQSVLLIESSNCLMFACACNTLSLIQASRVNAVGDFFDNHDDRFNQVISIIFVVIFVLMPFVIVAMIKKHLKELKQNQLHGLVQILVRDLKLDHTQRIFYTFYFIVRRIMIVSALVFCPMNMIVLQCLALIYISKFNLIYIAYFQPYTNKNMSRQEIFNEFTVLSCSYLLLSFLDININ
jgi:hypothetical protein